MKNLPIGIQSFEKLRKQDCLYIDKTEDILRLITYGSIYFLSRPRRFGKSLLISTLEALFKGKKELFEGLYIYDKWDWTQQNSVIRLDFGGLSYGNGDELNVSLTGFMEKTAEEHQLSLSSIPLSDKFSELIEKLHKSTGQRVVVLVDEYDKPIIDHLSNQETAKANREILRNVYQVLKAADEHLRFVFLTGITKFAKISVFSGLNSPDDITLDWKYTTICGYTQKELEFYFDEYIAQIASRKKVSETEVLEAIRMWYNGYSWDGITTVYNPYSTLSLFNKLMFANYWFETGTPSFLVKLLKEQDVRTFLEPVTTTADAFSGFDIEAPDLLSSLVQTGYLTIKSVEEIGLMPAQYTLGIPNREVKDSILVHFISSCTAYPLNQTLILAQKMQQQINAGDAESLAQSLRILLANIPYKLHLQYEAYYHSLFLSWMKLLDFDIHGEVMTNNGRIDAVWHQPNLTVVAEIKYSSEKEADSLLNDAIEQIRDRRYYEKYLDRKVLLMAVAFTEKELKCSFSLINA